VFELEEFSVLAVYSRLAELLDPGNQLEMFFHENKAGGGGAVGSSSTKWIRRMFRL
jgi:predicted outer membrane repeat protein